MNLAAPLRDRKYWEVAAKLAQPEGRAFIDGRYGEAISGRRFDKIGPIDGRVVAQVADCDAADIDQAVGAARRAFEDGRWRRIDPRARKRVLLRWAELILANLDELALLETLDVGKVIGNSLTVDVPFAADCIAYYAELADKLFDEVAPTAPGNLALVRREPLGVVGAIVPWNYPLIIAAWKLGPALVTGNSVVLKPAEQSPLTALAIAGLAREAGIPDGVLNVVPGFGERAGMPLALHRDVDLIAFTGSTETGRLIMRFAAESNLKRVALECGGKSPQVVLADADLDAAAEAIAWGIYYNQGETCHAGSRVIVERQAHQPLVERIVRAAAAIPLGPPLDPASQMGALIERQHMERVLGYIELGLQEGACIALGGRQAMAETGGFYVEATVLDHATNQMRVAQEEIFGPVLTVIPIADADQALRAANETVYGLAASVWTRDIDAAHRFANELRAGTVWINAYDRSSLATPFGGFKQSGFGRDRSPHAIEKYVDLKTVWTAYRP